jgi:hypothetical protein
VSGNRVLSQWTQFSDLLHPLLRTKATFLQNALFWHFSLTNLTKSASPVSITVSLSFLPVSTSRFSNVYSWTTGVRIPAEDGNFALRHHIQTSSGTQPASCTIGTEGSLHLHPVPRLRMHGATPQLLQYIFMALYLAKARDYFNACHDKKPTINLYAPLCLLQTTK